MTCPALLTLFWRGLWPLHLLQQGLGLLFETFCFLSLFVAFSALFSELFTLLMHELLEPGLLLASVGFHAFFDHTLEGCGATVRLAISVAGGRAEEALRIVVWVAAFACHYALQRPFVALRHN